MRWNRSGSRPAKAAASNSAISSRCCASLGASSLAKLMTPDVYRCLKLKLSMVCTSNAGSPASSSGGGRRTSPVSRTTSAKQ